MAMKRFDAAINQAKEKLKSQGFDQIEQICEMIMEKGGIRKNYCDSFIYQTSKISYFEQKVKNKMIFRSKFWMISIRLKSIEKFYN